MFHDGVIYLSRGYRSGPFGAFRPGGRGDISKSHVVWHVPTGAPYISSLVYYEGLLYMAGDVGVIISMMLNRLTLLFLGIILLCAVLLNTTIQRRAEKARG